ncbi:MAG: hypothetical protein AB1779_05405 [Candidatus Thermoplasmatota archaeon]
MPIQSVPLPKASRKLILIVSLILILTSILIIIGKKFGFGWFIGYLVNINPYAYAIIFFLYTIASTVFLPIPVEIALFISPDFPYLGKILILGFGKALGAIIIFQIGLKVEDDIRYWSKVLPQYEIFVNKMNTFVDGWGNIAIYIILSIPLMVDTVPLYLFSIFNKDGKGMERRYFIIANFTGGCTRAIVIYIAYIAWGVVLS